MAKKETQEQMLIRHAASAEREQLAEARRLRARAQFIEAVAAFLTTDIARKSIELQRGKTDAIGWAAIANSIPGGNGYDPMDKRIEQLTELLK